MDPESILSQIKTTLTNNTTLKTYIKSVHLGERAIDYRIIFPNITIEPVSNVTDRVGENNRKENVLSVWIAAGVLIHDHDLALVGDVTQKGIMDVEKDIKTALFAIYPDLNQKCLWFTLSTQSYTQMESANGRIVMIEGKFYYVEA